MTKFKITAVLIFALLLSISCSLIDNLKEKSGNKEKESEKKEEIVKEETTKSNSQKDLQFYNKYIDVLNKISEEVEQLQKAYFDDIPDPKTVKKNSMIFAIRPDVYSSSLERLIKEYNRSYFDNGELAKLEADNETMKNEIETGFKDVLKMLEEYYNTSRTVIDYYTNKEYENNPSLASDYDVKIREAYDKFKESYDKLNATVRKYKPPRNLRDPDKISNPDEKAAAVLMNTYENTLDGAEAFYEKFKGVNMNSDASEMIKMLDEFERKFNEDKSKVESVEFTDRTKYMKYSFEDYFSKTVNDFIRESKKFLDSMNRKKTNKRSFDSGYDNVINYYNYMINAYNSSINALNTFQTY
jgi:hypothetical protein